MLGGPLMADHLLPVPLMVGDILRPMVYLVGGLLQQGQLGVVLKGSGVGGPCRLIISKELGYFRNHISTEYNFSIDNKFSSDNSSDYVFIILGIN